MKSIQKWQNFREIAHFYINSFFSSPNTRFYQRKEKGTTHRESYFFFCEINFTIFFSAENEIIIYDQKINNQTHS